MRILHPTDFLRQCRPGPEGGGPTGPGPARRDHPALHIVHGSDFSRASAKAFATALALACANRARLTIAHVLSPVVPVAGEGYVLPETYEQNEASTRAAAQKQLDRLLPGRRRGACARPVSSSPGTPHEQLVRALKSHRADPAVIGTHGRTGLARFFLGSVAARVATLAACPVLTVRGR